MTSRRQENEREKVSDSSCPFGPVGAAAGFLLLASACLDVALASWVSFRLEGPGLCGFWML